MVLNLTFKICEYTTKIFYIDVLLDCLCNVITSWKLREGFSTVFVIFWDYLLGRYVLCCWSDDYGYEMCPNRNPLRLHFHNCVFYFWSLYVILLFNFVGDPNMNRPLFYHCNSPFSFRCTISDVCSTDWQKRTVHFWAALHSYSIANFVASWLKWLQTI